jgi:PAS domain S-box-containing protein
MNRSPRPLRLTLPLGIALLLTLITGLTVWLSVRHGVAEVEATARADLRLMVHRLERHAAEGAPENNVTLWADLAEARTDPRVMAAYVMDGRGRVLLSADRTHIGEAAQGHVLGYTDARLQQALRQMPPDLLWEPGPQRLSALLSNHWITGGDQSPQAQPLALYVVMSLQVQRADARWLAVRQRLPALLGELLLMVLLGVWLQRQVVRPLARLEDSSRRLAQGDGSARAAPRGVGEVRQLALAFNAMAEAQQRAQADLRASEERLATILYSTGDALLATDTAQHITLMNPVAEALTGWREHEARGRPVSEVFRIEHAHTGAPAAIPVARVLSDGVVVGLANHTVLVSRQGTRTHIADSAAPIRRGDGQLTGVVLVFRDVNETYRIEQALADSEWHYRVLANAGQALVFTADAKGGSLWCNDAWLRFSGQTRERAVAGGWMDAVHPDDHTKLRAQWQRAAREGQSGSEILRLYRVDGELRWYLTEVVSRRDSAGQHAGLIVRALDVTDQRDSDARLQAQVDELQRWHRVMLGREARVAELKHEVNALLSERGAAPRYPEAEVDGPAKAKPHTDPDTDTGAAATPPTRS